ncbi:PREDICTED: protein kish-B, partial [Ipomoea nil]|uniref:protein kish-B n=1 Tax=Ipomoea nil TaxID=35883 RepID=UPI000901D9C3
TCSIWVRFYVFNSHWVGETEKGSYFFLHHSSAYLTFGFAARGKLIYALVFVLFRIEGSTLGKLKYVVLLWICTCTYVKMHFPALLEQRTGFRGFFWKAARIGERLSPWVAVGCLTMGVSIIFF